MKGLISLEILEIKDKKFCLFEGGLEIYEENNIPIYLKHRELRNKALSGIKNSFINKIKHERKLNRVMELCIKSSNACNLSCEYCFRKPNSNSFDIDNISKFIESILKSNNVEKVKIDLTGDSEPLLEIDKLKEIIDLCDEIGLEHDVEFVYCLNSNGTIFNTEIQEFLYKNSVLFGFTYEGISLNRNQRVYNSGLPAIKEIEQNILRYGLNKNALFGLSMTLTSAHTDLVTEYKNMLNFSNSISMRIVNTFDKNGVNDSNLNLWKDKYTKLADFFLDELKLENYKTILPILKSRDFFGSYLQIMLYNIKKNQPCLAGYKQFFLNYDGSVYLCPWGNGNSKYKVGHNGEVNEDLSIKYKNATVDNDHMCKSCEWRYICGGECNVIKGDNSNLDSWCSLKKHLIGLAIYINDWIENNNPNIKAFLIKEVNKNTYEEVIEDYIRTIRYVFKTKNIRKGPNIIKNEIECIENGPSINGYIKYLEANNLKIKIISCGTIIKNDKDVLIIHEKNDDYNNYKIINNYDYVLKSSETAIIVL